MPQHKSAAKRVRQDEKRRLQNRQHKVRTRTLIRELRQMDDATEASARLDVVKAALDRMAMRRIIHPNKAAHAKSQLERYVRSLS